MKKQLTALFLILAVFMPTGVFAQSAAVMFRADESSVVRTLDKKLYGINFEWGVDGDGSGYFIEDAESSTKLNDAYIRCFKNNLPFSRMAGMSANTMKWKKAIGSFAQREGQTFWHYPAAKQRYGLVEWAGGNLRIDPYGEFAYTVNLEDLDNLADLIRFLKMTPDNPNAVGEDGTNWAQRRVDLGIEQPVPVRVWELGNEVDASPKDGGFGYGIDTYLQRCQRAISIIKSLDTETKISVQVKSDYWVGDWQNWHRTLLQNIGNDIDYISVHQYYSWDDVKVDNNNCYRVLKEDIQKYTGSDRIKVYVSEHSVSPPVKTWENSFEYMLPHTMGGTLATAEFFLKAASEPLIAMATYHTTQSASWVTAYEFKGEVKLAAPGHLLRMMNKYFTGDFLSSSLTGGTEGLFAGAVKTDDGLNVMLVNRGSLPQTFNFDFNKSYNLNSCSYITAASNEADNFQLVNENTGYTDIDKQEITCVYDKAENAADIKSYTVSPYTVMFLNLKEVKQTVSNDFEGYSLAQSYNSSSFTDEEDQGVSGNYYNAVINNGARADGDYSGSVYENGVYEANAAKNIWVYNDLNRRVYGGLKGYTGYVYPDDVNCSHNRWNHRLDVKSVANGTNKALVFLPAQRDDKNVVSSFGFDNIDMSQGGILKADLAFFKDLPEAKIVYTANPKSLYSTEKTFEVVKLSAANAASRTADVIFDGIKIGSVSVPESTNSYTPYRVEYAFSDSTHKMHRLTVTDIKTGETAADSGWRINANTDFFESGVFGVRVTLSTLRRSEPRMYLDNISYLNTAQDTGGDISYIYAYRSGKQYTTPRDNFYAYTEKNSGKLFVCVNNKKISTRYCIIYGEYDEDGRLIFTQTMKSVNNDITTRGGAYGVLLMVNNTAKIKPMCESLRIDYRGE